jgi:hypothetical protein
MTFCSGQEYYESHSNNFRGKDFELYSLKKIKVIIDSYTYENRLEKKGLASRTIVDSLELDYNIGDQIINFDKAIK